MSKRWIQVHNAIPKIDTDVLVYIEDSDFRTIGWRDGNIWHYLSGNGWVTTKTAVSWWMQWPDRPDKRDK